MDIVTGDFSLRCAAFEMTAGAGALRSKWGGCGYPASTHYFVLPHLFCCIYYETTYSPSLQLFFIFFA